MRILKNKKNDIEFVCESYGTRNGFNHKATMFVNGSEFESATCHYINRTWECYTYQSVILSCINKVIEWAKGRIEMDYRNKNNVSRLTKARKEELENLVMEFEDCEYDTEPIDIEE